ncbi:hypothetical protein L2E82_06563 [Cichorium intybus]|uniref:Uncharacterized protein n=1 Tax=Cichorium intybus TaxID=13427 RepID=A0ACB9HAA2_CICIN|nr:hypothetical protein L2E82_06563 [Cichorium intybus]
MWYRGCSWITGLQIILILNNWFWLSSLGVYISDLLVTATKGESLHVNLSLQSACKSRCDMGIDMNLFQVVDTNLYSL